LCLEKQVYQFWVLDLRGPWLLHIQNMETTGIIASVLVDKDTASERMVILPGSFNPLHDGHLRLSDIASRY
ncbi:hypothetical protein BHE74_00029383, partial [Ensete ventricosum]